jgi:hypothetical protein
MMKQLLEKLTDSASLKGITDIIGEGHTVCVRKEDGTTSVQ